MVAVVVLGGLGLTASGSSAAAALTTKVGTAVGVDLQAAPPAPPAPMVAPAAAPLPAPPAPRAPGDTDTVSTTTTADGRTVRKRVVHIHNGDRVEDAAWLKDMPQVSERDCKNGRDGSEKQIVVNSHDGKQRLMIICTNRIAKMASEGAAMAANGKDIERHALESALAGLRSARAVIAANTGMSAEQRTEALAGIDEGIAEVQADMAKPE